MTGTGNSLATRPNSAPSASRPGAALELHAGQTMWTKDQHAALVAMGIPREASSAELGVFLHQCQRTGLDPFSRQIYLIYRDSYENGRPVKKPTMQVGIDGYRLIRDRIAKRDGIRVEYEDTIWYADDGQACDVWLWNEPPAACKVAIKVDGRRFSSVLRFGEYCQRKKDGTLNKMWTEKPAHMIEKCAEADVLRRAFPQDLSGLVLEDTAPLADDAPPERQRVTGEAARARAQQVKAEVVSVTPDPAPEDAPWPGDAAPARAARNADRETGEVIPDAEVPTSGGAATSATARPSGGGSSEPSDPRDDVLLHFGRLDVAGTDIKDYLTRLSGKPLASVESLNRRQAQWFVVTLGRVGSRDELEAAAVAAETARAQDHAAEAGDSEVPDGQ